jgi:multisubunit Na+/H+ antiporter MnhE subunit
MERNGASRAGRGASIGLWAWRIAALAATWLLLTDSRNLQELILGAAAVTLVALATGLIAHSPPRERWARIRTALGLVPALLAQLVALAADSARMSWLAISALAARKPLRGRFRAAPYEPGRRRPGVGGVIATELIGSVAPNRYVVGVDEDRGIVMIHELAQSSDPVDRLRE